MPPCILGVPSLHDRSSMVDNPTLQAQLSKGFYTLSEDWIEALAYIPCFLKGLPAIEPPFSSPPAVEPSFSRLVDVPPCSLRNLSATCGHAEITKLAHTVPPYSANTILACRRGGGRLRERGAFVASPRGESRPRLARRTSVWAWPPEGRACRRTYSIQVDSSLLQADVCSTDTEVASARPALRAKGGEPGRGALPSADFCAEPTASPFACAELCLEDITLGSEGRMFSTRWRRRMGDVRSSRSAASPRLRPSDSVSRQTGDTIRGQSWSATWRGSRAG